MALGCGWNARILIYCNHRRLAQHDALPLDINQRIRCAKVNGHIVRKKPGKMAQKIKHYKTFPCAKSDTDTGNTASIQFIKEILLLLHYFLLTTLNNAHYIKVLAPIPTKKTKTPCCTIPDILLYRSTLFPVHKAVFARGSLSVVSYWS